MTIIDILIVVIYLLLLLLLPFFIKKYVKNSSDFIIASRSKYWWVGFLTLFVGSFSSWVFTGAVAKSYTDGFSGMAIFFGNGFAFGIAYLYFAKRIRQSRVDTFYEYVDIRFGRVSQQFNIVLDMPQNLFNQAIRLYAVSIFISACFNIPVSLIIVVCGILIVLIVFMGGTWGVSAINVLQSCIFIPTTLFLGIYSVYNYFYTSNVISTDVDFDQKLQLLQDKLFSGNQHTNSWIIGVWFFAMLINQTVPQQVHYTNGYLSMHNAKTVRLVAFLCMISFAIVPLFWFAPVWVYSLGNHDLSTTYSMLKDPSNAVYIAFLKSLHVTALTGLFVAIILSLTISALAGGVSNMCGSLVRNVYQQLSKQNADEKRLMIMARVITLLWGLGMILLAFLIYSLKSVNLFYIVVFMSSLVGFPKGIPFCIGLFYSKTPDWSSWTTTLFGFVVSATAYTLLHNDTTLHFILDFLGDYNTFDNVEINNLQIIMLVLFHCTLTVGFFFGTSLFYDRKKERISRRYKKAKTYFNIHKESLGNPNAKETDRQLKRTLSYFVFLFSSLVFLLIFIKNNSLGHLIFTVITISSFTFGLILHHSSKNVNKPK